jgi:hypothetical protein
MPSFKLFQNLRERSQSSGLEGSNLPPYSEVSKTDPTSLERFKRIASQIPQWTWCTNECRTWLKAVCIVYFNFSPEKADATAQKFEGFGPTIYMKTRVMDRVPWGEWKRPFWTDFQFESEERCGSSANHTRKLA